MAKASATEIRRGGAPQTQCARSPNLRSGATNGWMPDISANMGVYRITQCISSCSHQMAKPVLGWVPRKSSVIFNTELKNVDVKWKLGHFGGHPMMMCRGGRPTRHVVKSQIPLESDLYLADFPHGYCGYKATNARKNMITIKTLRLVWSKWHVEK